jgi:hypothetical protein
MLPRGVKDLRGKKFGRLLVEKYMGVERHHARWLCTCDCGRTRVSTTTDLIRGRNKSCGCLRPNKKAPGEAAFNDLYRRYKYDAKGKRRAFSISKRRFRDLVTSPCHYCGAPPSKWTTYKEAYNGQFRYNGLDRVNNRWGYTCKNCVPCCERCNKAKRGMTEEEFLQWIYTVHAHTLQQRSRT